VLLKMLGNHTALALRNSTLTDDLRQSFLDIVEVLVRAIEVKDIYTSGHCERVREFATKIGASMKLPIEDLETLELAALLHDIGKIGMPETILNNTGSLTDEEYSIMKNHPSLGYEMLDGILSLGRINKIILQHHERYDGKGYPQGLEGTEIDLLARILSVSDAVDAMTSRRSYRRRQPLDYVLAELRKNSGKQFDPQVVAHAIEILDI